jgi:Zn-dependent protease with chaperone function
VLVTAAMLVLPVLYLCLIAAVVYLLFWHATNNLGAIKSMHSFLGIIFVYAGPLIAGGILVLFMVKPLFARPAKAGKDRFLELAKDPLVFAFVTRIARAVNAPEPKRIAVNGDLNASASLGQGVTGLFGSNLVLTLGLPLVAGLTLQQLAGVLAHELGHFAQGAGMRLSYVIRSINSWFARVVYQRDVWDQALVQWSQESGRLSLIFYLARFAVWTTRGILWVFMIVGHGISCLLLRQMEVDADRYSTRLVGSAASGQAFKRLVALEEGMDASLGDLLQCMAKDRYPDDFPSLVVAHANDLTTEQRRELDKQLKQTSTGFFDSHPSLKDRLRNSRLENARGIFHLDRPATVLFQNFPALSSRASLDFYSQLFRKPIKRANLVPTALFRSAREK